MRTTIITVTLSVLATASALPGHSKKPCKSDLAAATAGVQEHRHEHHHEEGPYGFNNATGAAGSTGLYASSTATLNPDAASSSDVSPFHGKDKPDTAAAAGSSTAASDVSEPDATGAADAQSAAGASGAAGSCGAPTVTVTVNPTVTVTAGSGASAPADTQSAPESSVQAVSAGQSAPPSDVASAAPIESSPVAPAKTSAAAEAEPSKKASPTAAQQESSATAIPTAAASSAAASAPANNAVPATNKAGQNPKRGIMASGRDQHPLTAAFGNTKVSWLGDWYSGPPTNLPDSLSFVPQLYDNKSMDSWGSNYPKALARGEKYFLSYGEPEAAHWPAAEAAATFMKQIQPVANQGGIIGSPPCLQNDGDRRWVSEFLGNCTECSIGFISLHWMWNATPENVQSFKDTVAKYKAIADGRPLWVDNFAAHGSVEAQKQFLGEVVPWMDSQDYIQRYAYVPMNKDAGEENIDDANGMVDNNGKITELGTYYANL